MIDDIEFERPVTVSPFIWITCFVVAVSVLGCSYVNQQLNIPDDHLVEELLEEVIESQIHLDIDLTPLSPE